MLVVVRASHLSHIAGPYFLSADDDGNINHELALSLEFFL